MAWSVGDVDHMLVVASTKILDARADIQRALECCDESEAVLSEILCGTRDQETSDVLARQGETSRALAEARGLLQAIVHRIEAYQYSLGTRTTSRSTAISTPNPKVEGADATEIRNERGSRSAWDEVQGEKPNPAAIHIAQGDRIHILDGDGLGGGGHAPGTGIPGKYEFPASWDDDDGSKIINAVEDVAKNPVRPPVLQGHGTYLAVGTRDGVDIEVIVTNYGRIVTGYPTGGDGVTVNDLNGNPAPVTPRGIH